MMSPILQSCNKHISADHARWTMHKAQGGCITCQPATVESPGLNSDADPLWFSVNSMYLLGCFSLSAHIFNRGHVHSRAVDCTIGLCYVDPQPDNEGQQPVMHIDGANTLLLPPTQAVALLSNIPLMRQEQTKAPPLSLMPQGKQFTDNLQ